MDVQKFCEDMKRPHAQFPYLIVRLMPAVYGLCRLPAAATREYLIDLAQREHAASGHELSMCLVLSEEEALYIAHDGSLGEGPRPGGGHVVDWKLRAPVVAAEVPHQQPLH